MVSIAATCTLKIQKESRIFITYFRLDKENLQCFLHVAAIGSTFDEIVVQSNLQVRGKSPSSRSRNFPTTKSNSTISSSTTTAPEPKP